MAAIVKGMKKYTDIPVPALVIFAGPWIKNHPDLALGETAKARSAEDGVLVEKQARAFENGVSSARIVRLSGPHHYIFLSNEPDVLREIHAFAATLR
jgi:hypothetical protein